MKVIVRKRIVFYGWVQGVGFRFRAKHAADRFSATGWVRNDAEGSVTMEIQGTEEAIEKVILTIEQSSYIRIENLDIREIPVIPEERSFGYRWDSGVF